ncbi:trithorax group protein osa isoform X1 [Drosophila sulfurigaster albostrigata]|uniref:trithorax group protein osa isoform X1 n=1 Tax=Drosophila sulfurigaster albostrigata TaxID=89887 RepID=UPI002D2190E0|nr:trithorax group protein osa isoform X1 [Drosophila sulfurigaster albostrigata]
MNEKIKSPSAQGPSGGPGPVASGAPGSGGAAPPGGAGGGATPPTSGPPTPNNGSDAIIQQGGGTVPHPYGGPPPGSAPGAPPDPAAVMSHYHHLHQQQQQQQPQHPQQGPPMPPHMQHHGGPPPGGPQGPLPLPGGPEHTPGGVKDEYGSAHLPPPPQHQHAHPAYARYHAGDPNIDPYRYGHAPAQQPPPGSKPPPHQQQQQQQQQPPGAGGSPNRPPQQRYIPGQPPQGPTPTLNSLLQSSNPPPPPQHRYANNYESQQVANAAAAAAAAQQQQQQQQQQHQQNAQQQAAGPPPPLPGHGPPPPQHQPYGGQQGGWAPPPRPYSPQLGPSQQYRTPPPQNTSRGQSPYPSAHSQNSGSYPSSPQQQQQQQQAQQQQAAQQSGAPGAPGAPPPGPSQQQQQQQQQNTPPTSQYSPYPQRYPTPPGLPASGPNHRTAYTTHQYSEPNRPWPGGSSPSPGPGHPLPPASPHHAPLQQPPTPHSAGGGPPPSSSPGHAPSPSPQPSQASPSPHQELIGQNSNDSSSGGAHSGMGSGPPGTPNPQQVMRPTPSPTGSSGSRSMSPAVAQNHPISRPASNQSSSGGPMQQPTVVAGPPPMPPHGLPGGPPSQQQSQQQQASNSASSASNSPQQTPPPAPPPNQNVNNMATPPPPQGSTGGYPIPQHMHGSYKMGGPGQSPGAQGYPPQQYPQGNYPPRPQYPAGAYGTGPPPPPSSQATGGANNMSSSAQSGYPRSMPNHSGGSPHPQYPPYQWVPPSPQQPGVGSGQIGASMGNHVQGKGTPPPVGPGPPPPQGSGSPRPLNYLKQHLQHKGGYGANPAAPQPQGYGNGPTAMHPTMPMGPPHHMGPPQSMGPPTSTPPQSMMGAQAGNESGPEHISQDNGISSSGPASGLHAVTAVVTTGPDGTPMDEVSQQSTLSNASAASGEDPQCTTPKSRKHDPYSQSHLAPPSTSPHPAVMHGGGGPSGEEYDMNSPPNWPRPAAGSQVFNSHVPVQQEPFRSTITTTKKSDSLCKLYEMDDNPDRRGWLDKLRSFMEERRTPITACPTISKQPLDLYRLYIYVKERGGFVEVCKVTKSKTWKDIAGLLGIGASSSAAYTLRKHYTKNLLAFECHFDRGDIDPLPIIQQVEAGSKKKTTKAASVPSPDCAIKMLTSPAINSNPGGGHLDAGTTNSTGSSNSQDSFPAPPGGAPNTAIDGYTGYTGGGAYPTPSGPQPDYGAAGQMQRPPSQNNPQAPHPGTQNQTAAAVVAGDNINVSNPFEDPIAGGGAAGGAAAAAAAAAASVGVGGPSHGAPPPPPHSPHTAPQSNNQHHQQGIPTQLPPPSQQQPPAPPPQQHGPPSTQHARPAAGVPYPPGSSGYPTPVSRTPGSPYPTQPGAYGQYGSGDQYNAAGPPGQQFGPNQGQYPPQNRNMYPPYGPEGEAPPAGANQYGPYGNRPYSQAPPGGPQPPTQAVAGGPPASGAPGAPPNSGYAPGTPNQQDYYRPPDQSPQPRRHPDFIKDSQPYSGYAARPQLYGGWQGGNQQYRAQYPTSSAPQSWGNAPPRGAAPPGGPHGPHGQQPAGVAQWEQHRYPPQQPPPPPQQQQPPYQQGAPPGQQQQQTPPQWAQINATPPQANIAQPGSSLRPPLGGAQQQQQRLPSGVPVMSPQQQQGQTLPQPPHSNVPPSSMPPVAGGLAKPPYAMPPPSQAGGVLPGVPMVGTPPGSMIPQKQPPIVGQGMQPTQPPHQMPNQQPVYAPQVPGAPGSQLVKKELIFPHDSVESTTPVLYRRKRLTKADVCPVDPWRIFMAMRSGLLTECTWALDVLNVLLFDDATVQFFGISNLPGLLTLLLEHFQKNLAEMFDERGEESIDEADDDADSGTVISLQAEDRLRRRQPRCVRSICSYNRRRHYENMDVKRGGRSEDSDDADEGIDLGQVRVQPNPEERSLLLSFTPNYTMVTRKGVPVRIQTADHDIFVDERQKAWDIDTNKLYEQLEPVGSNAWTYGFTEPDPLDGIIDVFKSEIVNIPFARYVRTKHKGKSTEESAQKTNSLRPQDEETSAAMIKQEDTTNSSSPEDSSLLQQTYNKKRRLVSSSGTTTCVELKKSKLEDEFAQPVLEVKKEPGSDTAAAGTADSDCRPVDMEIESPQQQRLTNGVAPQPKGFDPKSTVRDEAHVLQRRRDSSFEDECYTRDESSLYLVNDSQDSLARRCIALSNIFRNLTFVPGNETVLAKSTRFLAVLGRLLLLNHDHLRRTPKTRNYDREEDSDFTDSCSSLQGEREWWWEYLITIRENMLVSMANIAGHLELSRYDELIARPLIDGLLHWAVCPSAHGQDPFPSCGPNSALSPQRLALEALCKLCVTDANVDLVIATPPFSRLEKLCAVLTRHLCRNEDQVLREFSVNLLHYLAAADSAMARTVALQSPCISYLVAFIEQAEQTALGVANQHGINYLRENPDSMGTSLDMLRRAAGTLLHLAKHPDNRSLFMQQEQRLLGLVMSHILDQQVALIISRVLYQVSRGTGPMHSVEYRLLQQRQQQQQRSSLAATEKPIAPTTTASAATPGAGASTAAGVAAGASVVKSETNVQPDQPVVDAKPTATAAVTTATIAVINDDSSNSSQQLPPAATFNDVSNSSTNSNSCGTVSSNQTNTSSLGSNSQTTLNNLVTQSEQQQQQPLGKTAPSAVATTSPLSASNLGNLNVAAATAANSAPPAPVAQPAAPPPTNANTTAAVA